MKNIIGSNLLKIRTINKFTLEKMGEIMGTTRQTYAKYENGDNDIRWDNMARLRINLGIDLNELVLDEYKFKLSTHKLSDNGSLQQLFIDFIDYKGDPDILRKEIVQTILNKTILKKPFAMKVLKLQNNRLIVELITMLTHIKEETDFNKTSRSKAKNLLEETIKKHKADLFSNMVKKSLLKKLEILTSVDCYYLITYSNIAIQILSDTINKFDKQTMRYLGCKVIKN